MGSPEPTTVIVPFNLGAASKYEGDIFPLSYHKAPDAIRKGSLLLSATLDEMIKIGEMGIDLNTDTRFHFNARAEYEALAAKEAKLHNPPKSLNPFTMFRHYRAVRMFHAATKALFVDTKRTSERIQREERYMQAVPSTELHTMTASDTVPHGATIGGIAVQLPGSLNDDAQKKLLAATNAIVSRANAASDPFSDNPRVSQLSDDDSIYTLADTESVLSQDAPSSEPQEVDPLSPGSPSYHFHLYNSVFSAGSSIHEMTLNHGEGHRGSTVIQHPPP